MIWVSIGSEKWYIKSYELERGTLTLSNRRKETFIVTISEMIERGYTLHDLGLKVERED